MSSFRNVVNAENRRFSVYVDDRSTYSVVLIVYISFSNSRYMCDILATQ